MIWESHPWKLDLYKRAEWLKAKKAQRRWPESAMVRVEQCIMHGCCCVRKLVEAGELTDSVAKGNVPLVAYKARGKPVHFMNWHHLEKLYDLEDGAEAREPLTFVCNQLIHSYVCINGFSDSGGLDFVMFCSDFERNRFLFQLSIDDLANAFIAVAEDDVVEAHLVWNASKKDYERILK